MKRAAKTAAPVRTRFSITSVEINIEGSMNSVMPDVLRECAELARLGQSATIKVAGIKATVKVTR